MTSPAIKALADLAAQLGVSTEEEDEKTHDSSSPLLVRGEDDDDCDFSSFPSLSLEETPGNYHTGIFTSRGDVESHVESLLSRPVLLGQQPADEPESDSLDEFFVESLQQVPRVMLTNFATSFSTLMNSRLRAYAKFLARHAVSLARCSEEVDSVIGIEHKLETMLGIGSEISTGRVVSEFVIDPDKAETVAGEEGEATQVSVPLKAMICVHISLPHVKEDDGDELMKVSFQVNGKICGIFGTNDSQGAGLLRVAEVSLNMHELLTGMAEQASKVISCIVEMTNAAFAVPLPATPGHSAIQEEAPSLPERKPVVTFKDVPTLTKKHKCEDGADEDTIVSLSAEKCANLIDCLIGELDDTVLSPPCPKKLKVFEQEPPHAILNH